MAEPPVRTQDRCALLCSLIAKDPVARELNDAIMLLVRLGDAVASTAPMQANVATAAAAAAAASASAATAGMQAVPVPVPVPVNAPQVRARMAKLAKVGQPSTNSSSQGHSSTEDDTDDDGGAGGAVGGKRGKSHLQMTVPLEVLALEAACGPLDYAGQFSTTEQWEVLCTVLQQVHSSFLPSFTPAARSLPCWRSRLGWWVAAHFDPPKLRLPEKRGAPLKSMQGTAATEPSPDGSLNELHDRAEDAAKASGASADNGGSASTSASAAEHEQPADLSAATRQQLYHDTLKAACSYFIYGKDPDTGQLFPFVAMQIEVLRKQGTACAALLELFHAYTGSALKPTGKKTAAKKKSRKNANASKD